LGSILIKWCQVNSELPSHGTSAARKKLYKSVIKMKSKLYFRKMMLAIKIQKNFEGVAPSLKKQE
jgi:hypothetical protein